MLRQGMCYDEDNIKAQGFVNLGPLKYREAYCDTPTDRYLLGSEKYGQLRFVTAIKRAGMYQIKCEDFLFENNKGSVELGLISNYIGNKKLRSYTEELRDIDSRVAAGNYEKEPTYSMLEFLVIGILRERGEAEAADLFRSISAKVGF